MGTPEFALPSLQKLIDGQELIQAVITQPDRHAGRGKTLKASSVKELALKHGLPVFQPANIKSSDSVDFFRTLSPDLVVVVAYGQLISPNILDIPSYGFINVHSSLLPAYRGPAPVNWAIINGETLSGATIIKLDEGMDSGDIILQQTTPVLPVDNASTLHDRLAVLGADLLYKALDQLKNSRWEPAVQDHTKTTHAPMLKKSDGLILWNNDAETLLNKVRGMNPWPGCFSFINSKMLKIHAASVVKQQADIMPGTILSVSIEGIEVSTGQNSLLLKKIQIEGKRVLPVHEFIKGFSIEPGTRFHSSR